MDYLNPELIQIALHSVRGRAKRAFVPSDAVAGNAPPPDAGGGGGGPPPGGPPPGGGGGGPPPDMGGGGGGGPPGGVDLASALPQMVQSAVQQAMAQSGMQGQPGVAGTGAPGKPAKPDINTVAMDVFQLKKMFLHFIKTQGIELPPDILDGPNRDPSTGMPVPPDPTGGMGGAMGAAGGMPGGNGGAGGPIPPIQPMQAATPAPPGGGKMAAFEPRVGEETSNRKVSSKAAAVALICRQRAAKKEVMAA